MTFGLDIEETNKNYLKQIEEIQSKGYRDCVENILIEINYECKLSYVDISCIQSNDKIPIKNEEILEFFDHIYIKECEIGKYSAYIFVPITKNLYLRSYFKI